MGVSSSSGVSARDRISHPGVRTGNYYLSLAVLPSASAAVLSGNNIYYQPIALNGTVNRIGLEVTAGAAGLARLGLYSNNGGVPGALILDCGTVDVTNIAIVEAVIPDMVLTGDMIWMAVVSNASPTCRSGTFGSFTSGMIVGGSTPSAAVRSYLRAFPYAVMSDPAPVPTNITSSGAALWLRYV